VGLHLKKCMSISKVDKIDLVSRCKATGNYELVIVADEPWENSDEFRYKLQEKLNNYSTYFLEGQLKKEYPDCRQNRITVRISSTTSIPEDSVHFIEKISDAFRPHGIDVATEVLE